MTEILITGDAITIPVACPPPVNRGSVTASLAVGRGSLPAHPTLERTLVWDRGAAIPALTLFARDVRAVWPRGGRAWLVVRYAGQFVHTSELRLVFP